MQIHLGYNNQVRPFRYRRGTALYHKPRNHPMKYKTVIKTAPHKFFKILNCFRCLVRIQFPCHNSTVFHFNLKFLHAYYSPSDILVSCCSSRILPDHLIFIFLQTCSIFCIICILSHRRPPLEKQTTPDSFSVCLREAL